MTALQVDIRQKIFPNEVCTIRNLTFSAQAGEFVAVVGPSGAGKTTLLNIVAGLDRQIDGEIKIDGQAAADFSGRMGFLFQDSRLMPWLTAIDNVRLVLERHEDNVKIARNLLRQVGLEEFEQAWPRQLSGGMQRRVALARAFAVQPHLLLMDEPFQSLDSPTANHLRGLLLQLWARTRPILLFVTHDLREALAMADRVVFLSHRPASILKETTVKLSRPRQFDGPEVNGLYTRLLREHPGLLTGLAAGPTDSRIDGSAPIKQ